MSEDMLSKSLTWGTFPAIESSKHGHSWQDGCGCKDGGYPDPVFPLIRRVCPYVPVGLFVRRTHAWN